MPSQYRELRSGLAFGHFGPFVAKTIQYTSSGSSSAPRANFVANPMNGAPPLFVQFTDISTNSPTSWQWNFGDGSPNSTAQSPSHIFTGTGWFTVMMTASNAQGSSTTYSTVNVHQGLSAGFMYSQGGYTNAPLTVYFTDASTGPVTSWQWNFGDGTTSTSRNPTHIYGAGVFTVILTVTDNAGDTAVDSTTVTVNPTLLVNKAGDITQVTKYPSGSNNYYMSSGVRSNGAVWVPQSAGRTASWNCTFTANTVAYTENSLAHIEEHKILVDNLGNSQEKSSIPASNAFSDGSMAFVGSPKSSHPNTMNTITTSLCLGFIESMGIEEAGYIDMVNLMWEIAEGPEFISTSNPLSRGYDYAGYTGLIMNQMKWQQSVGPGQQALFRVNNYIEVDTPEEIHQSP